MKSIALISMFIFAGCMTVQSEDQWEAFTDKNTELVGFKDQDGNIKIEPKFERHIPAKKFDKIMAAIEEKNGKMEFYYLTKSGKIVGKDQLYLFDNNQDCESEGFIRFRDHETDTAGMFNGDGDVAIPAKYNDLTSVHNGLVWVLEGAEKKCWHEEPRSCEHAEWIGGKQYLINTSNQVIIKDFKYDSNLDFYSLKIDDLPNQDPNRKSFIGADGRYYSFIDYEKEFKSWLNTALLDAISREKLIQHAYKDIYIFKEPKGWTAEPGHEFIDRNFELIKLSLTEINNENADYFISIDSLNPFTYEAPEFETYFNNCGEAQEWKYPVMSLVINHRNGKNSTQDLFDFIRTENGYKLISITIRRGNLK